MLKRKNNVHFQCEFIKTILKIIIVSKTFTYIDIMKTLINIHCENFYKASKSFLGNYDS